MPDEVVYHPLHPLQVARNDGTEDAMSFEERQVFEPRPFCKWWCQSGPVDTCCCCFPLRTGITLMALDNLISGLAKSLYHGAIRVKGLELANMKRTYERTCITETDKEGCVTLSEVISGVEAEHDFMVALTPVVYFLGVLLVAFSLVGFAASCTGKTRTAKVYMMAFPVLFLFCAIEEGARLIMAPSSFTPEHLFLLGFQVFFIAYYFKVAWSFFYRRKVSDASRLATAASSQGRTINVPVTQSPSIV